MRTKNTYAFPVNREHIVKVSYDESPAHVARLKYAIDFIVPEGTPVKATAAGTVIDLQDGSEIGGTEKKFEELGNFIEIRRANGEYSEYEHLKKGSLVKPGDKVKKGQIIGYSGATGWIANLGPHLHFMVGIYGKTIREYKTLEIVFEKQ